MRSGYRLTMTCARLELFPLLIVASTAGCTAPQSPGGARASADAPGSVLSRPAESGAAPTGLELPTGLWSDVTAELLGPTEQWTNGVELADLDGDGRVDILFANGGNYSEAGELELNRAFFNRGSGEPFEERTEAVFGRTPDTSRVIKARDLDGDGHVDIVVGNTFQTRSRLFLGQGGGAFTEVTATHLPDQELSVGDLELGDVDADGDLDLVLADWGPGDNMVNDGGRTRLWLNDGAGHFSDVTAERMPRTLVEFSWDLEFVDVDNDFDLDVVVSCKRCANNKLYRNDGSGVFEEASWALPAYTNNYEFEALDLDGDGFLDLVTVNDGQIVAGGGGASRREHVFRNRGGRFFQDMSTQWWPASENVGEDDNMVAFLDFDSDGDADFVLGSLTGRDRLLINDGDGALRMADEVIGGEQTPGTLAIALADLDGDGRLDLVQAQGEHPQAVDERLYLGTGLAMDSAPPHIGPTSAMVAGDGGVRVVARVHDRKSPAAPHDLRGVELRWSTDGESGSAPMAWYGEFLWRAELPPGIEATSIEIVATDAVGNQASVEVTLEDAEAAAPAGS